MCDWKGKKSLNNLFRYFWIVFFDTIPKLSSKSILKVSCKTILQSYSNQDNMVLAQKLKYRSMEQDRKPRDKPMHLWPTNL